jgi:hypothetical protein
MAPTHSTPPASVATTSARAQIRGATANAQPIRTTDF